MDKLLKVILALTAVDRMSTVVRSATGKAISDLDKLKDKAKGDIMSGAGLMATGAGIVASLAPAVKAYAELEDSSTSLKTAMMDATGAVGPEFEKINQLAEDLGGKLPGNTSDFQRLFEVMRNNGVSARSIIDGVGKSAAYLGVAIQMPYEEAGKFAAKMKEATGVADSEMIQFLDTIARTRNLGVDAQEMQYAFGRSAGSLKLMGLQGLEASKHMSILYASWIRAGLSGETVGTGFSAITAAMLDPKKYIAAKEAAHKLGVDLSFFKNGKFLGIEHMVSQLDKLKGFSASQRASVVNALTGGGQDAQMLQVLISNGIDGFKRLGQQMNNQADLNTKVNTRLGTFNSMMEAAGGAVDNMLAALGEQLAPELKKITELFGNVVTGIRSFLQANPGFAKFVGIATAAIGTFTFVAGAILSIKGAMTLLNIVVKANPWMRLLAIVIFVVSAIYANWDKISGWFSALWGKVKSIFTGAWNFLKNLIFKHSPIGSVFKLWAPLTRFFGAIWDLTKAVFGAALGILKGFLLNFTPAGLIYKHWDKIVDFFTGIWDKVKGPFLLIYEWVMAFGSKFFDAGKNIIDSIVNGISASIDKVTNKIKEVTQSIRDHFPFSPAKTGPLRDIHRIRLIETIAGSIKQKPLVDAVRKVTVAAVGAFQGAPSGMGAPAGYAGAGAMGGNITVHFSPQIGGGSNGDILQQLRGQIPQLVTMLRNEMERQQRKDY